MQSSLAVDWHSPDMAAAVPSPHLSVDETGMSPADWDTIFANPLNPSMFAVLAANGVLGPPTPSPAPASIPLPAMSPPSSSLYDAYNPSSAMGKQRVQQQQQQPMMRSDRPTLGLAPSLWMTPAASSTNYNVYPTTATLPSVSPSTSIQIPQSAHSQRSPHSPQSPPASVVSNSNSLRSRGSSSNSNSLKAGGSSVSTTLFTDLFQR
ncbi:hypothetical protein FA13DRAFT_1807321 [Coprinellus micaceus]|uniref:Uncharacterized protein n=1 Tax=Coprinellus micaceus TaxID=71717 RepID=A0A4Y7RBY4_COPMI|nr:hypothetical protein FA13DRAFT_1807321 [Coprinellus micaceus]